MEADIGFGVQNGFFNQVRKEHRRITILLSNGQSISGQIKSFDRFTLLLDTRQGEQIVFKHAIASVSARPQGVPDRQEKEREGAASKDPAPGKRGFGNFIDLSETKG